MSTAKPLVKGFFDERTFSIQYVVADPSDPAAPNVDSFVLSKGHAAPILWAALHEAGAITEYPMSLRKIDSTLEVHPTPLNPWVKVATGSLGQGLAAANGMLRPILHRPAEHGRNRARLAAAGKIPYAATFACFLTRA